MNGPLFGSNSDVSYSVDYEAFTNSSYNLELKGHGRLLIRNKGPIFEFSGKSRRFLKSKPVTVSFPATEIVNVTVEGRLICFHSPPEAARQGEPPFAFYCQDATEAAAVGALFPCRAEEEFSLAQDFTDQLDALTKTPLWWASITNIIIALNVVMFVFMGLNGSGWFTVTSMRPYFIFGANNGAATTDGEWWRLIASLFIHYGVHHLALNMWALYQAGNLLEKLQGRLMYMLTYLGSGVAAGFASIFWQGDKIWSAGASGAVFGVYGALLSFVLRKKEFIPLSFFRPILASSITFGAYNFLYIFAKRGIDNSAHLGGVLAGLVLGWIMALPVHAEIRRRETPRRLWFGLIFVTGIIIAGVWLTPRFDYNVHEQLVWEDANRFFRVREPDLRTRLQETLESVKTPSSDGKVQSEWITAEVLPFYQNWLGTIDGLPLTPGQKVARQRDAVAKIVHQQIAQCQLLSAGLLAHDPLAIPHFVDQADEIQPHDDTVRRSAPSD